MSRQIGSKLAGAMNKRSSSGALQRVSPGIYRNAQGQLVGAKGQPIAKSPVSAQASGVVMGQMPTQQPFNPLPPGGAYTKPAVINDMRYYLKPGEGGPIYTQTPPQNGMDQISPEKLAEMRAEYEAAKNYRPDFKEGQVSRGSWMEQKYKDMAKQRERILNNPLNQIAFGPLDSGAGWQLIK